MNRLISLALTTILSTSYSAVITCCTQNDGNDSSVQVAGAMRNVMWKGQIQGAISLDTISNRQHLYGLGPLEYLAGELLIVDGKTYRSTVLSDNTIKVEETSDAKAPFFVYASIDHWKEQELPDSIRTLQQLEAYLDQITKTSKRPFAFKLNGTVKTAIIHIVDLPEGSKVNSPEDVRKIQRIYDLQNKPSEVIGFFSTEHKAIFTHHDTYLHVHLITQDKSQMGHLDEMTLIGGVKLFLPEQ